VENTLPFCGCLVDSIELEVAGLWEEEVATAPDKITGHLRAFALCGMNGTWISPTTKRGNVRATALPQRDLDKKYATQE
jgi:hypothetical protein